MSRAAPESFTSENVQSAPKSVGDIAESKVDSIEHVMHFRVDISVRTSSSSCESSRSSLHEKELLANSQPQSKTLPPFEAFNSHDAMKDTGDEDSLLSDVESEAPETLVAFQEVLQSLLEQHQQDRKRKKSALSDATSSCASSKPTTATNEARVPSIGREDSKSILTNVPVETIVPSLPQSNTASSLNAEPSTLETAESSTGPKETKPKALARSQKLNTNGASSSSGIQQEIRQRFEQRPPNPNVVALRVARSHEIEGILTQRRVSAIPDTFRQRLEDIVRETPSHMLVISTQTGSNVRSSSQPGEARSTTAGIQAASSEIVQGSTYERVEHQPMERLLSQQDVQAAQPLSQRQVRPQIPQQPPARNSGPAVVQGTMRNVGIARELGDVTQYHTVSTMLSGEFRQRLERLIHRRLVEAGVAPSARVIQRNINPNANPNARFARNTPMVADFDLEALDGAVAAGSGRARDIQSIVSREVEVVRQEVMELRRMLCASLEMQMEMQRTLRQEISASLFSQRQTPAAPATFNTQHLGPQKAETCLICCEKAVDCAFYKCGHMCSCHMCALNMQQRNQPCPICRAPIREVLRVYHTS